MPMDRTTVDGMMGSRRSNKNKTTAHRGADVDDDGKWKATKKEAVLQIYTTFYVYTFLWS